MAFEQSPLTPSIMASVAFCLKNFFPMFWFLPETPPHECTFTYGAAFPLLYPLAKHLPQGWAHSRTLVNTGGIVSTCLPSRTVTIVDFIGKFQKNQGSVEAARLERWFPSTASCTGACRQSSFQCSSVKWENVRKSFCKPKFFYKSAFFKLKDFPLFWE